MADDNSQMAAALYGGMLPAPPPSPDVLGAALGSPLTNFHPYHPGDDPMAEIKQNAANLQQNATQANPYEFAMGIMGGPRNLRLLPNPAMSAAGGPSSAFHDIVDPSTAKSLGYISLNTSNPKKLWVNMIDSFGGNQGR